MSSKYNAKKVTVNGILFDSKQEAEYYELLLKKQELGIVKEIEMQPVLNLSPSFEYFGKKRRRTDYKLDFRIVYSDGVEVYVDVKGMATETAKIKRKWAESTYPSKHIIWLCKSIKWGDKTGWIEYDDLVKKRAASKRATNK